MTTTAKPKPLTKRQCAFRDAILAGFPPSQAYRKAFNATGMSKKAISVEAQRVLHYDHVSLAISLAVNDGRCSQAGPPLTPTARMSMEERLEELRCAARLNPSECFDELNHFKSIREMPEHVQRAIASFKIDPVSFITEVKFIDKISSIMSYSKLSGDIPREKGPVAPVRRVQFDLSQLTDDELKEHMRLRRKAMVQLEDQTT